jgi:hypothetical protein
VDITRAFPMGLNFFGATLQRAMFVNTNGNITFRAALGPSPRRPSPSPTSR